MTPRRRADIDNENQSEQRQARTANEQGMNMTATIKPVIKIAMALLISATAGLGQAPPELQAKINAKIKQLESFSTDPQVVNAVKTYNSTPPSPEVKAMTNDKWHSLTLFDPFVREIGKNALSEFLKGMRNDVIIKSFARAHGA